MQEHTCQGMECVSVFVYTGDKGEMFLAKASEGNQTSCFAKDGFNSPLLIFDSSVPSKSQCCFIGDH